MCYFKWLVGYQNYANVSKIFFLSKPEECKIRFQLVLSSGYLNNISVYAKVAMVLLECCTTIVSLFETLSITRNICIES